MGTLSDWVVCHLLVCVPSRLLDPANEATLEARKRLLQDPVLGDIASVEVCAFTSLNRSLNSQEVFQADVSMIADRIHRDLVDSVHLPALSTAPAIVFCLLIVDRKEEIERIVTDVAAHTGLAALPVVTRSLAEDEKENIDEIPGSALALTLEQEIMQSIGSTLEKAEGDTSFRVPPGNLLDGALSTLQNQSREDDEESKRDRADDGPSFSALYQAVIKARSQLTVRKVPTATEAIDQASQREQSIQLLYLVTVTGSPFGFRKGGLKWAADLGHNLTRRVSLIESDDDVGPSWYVSFISAGEGIERVVPPCPIASVGRRHASAKPMGYDFDFLECARETISLIREDISAFARRGTPVTGVRTVILSNELPLADTDTVDGYRELCELSPIAWVLGSEAGELSAEFLSDRSHIFLNHDDVVEELVSVEFQPDTLLPSGRHALVNDTSSRVIFRR